MQPRRNHRLYRVSLQGLALERVAKQGCGDVKVHELSCKELEGWAK